MKFSDCALSKRTRFQTEAAAGDYLLAKLRTRIPSGVDTLTPILIGFRMEFARCSRPESRGK
jgi:hypothetical protein